jgi:hypothetical protein
VIDKLASLAVDLPEYFLIIAAPYKPDPKDKHSPLPQVAFDKLRVVRQVLHGWDLEYSGMLVVAEHAVNMAKGDHHTWRTCLKVPDKDKWMEVEFEILDKNYSYGMYGTTTKRRDIPPAAKIVCPIWNYSQKGNGVHKA